MLRRICSACGSVIDGEPIIEKEYADAVLVIDDEVEAVFDDLCDRCRERLRRAVAHAFDGEKEEQRPSKAIEAEKPTEIEDIAETAPAEEADAVPCHEEYRPDGCRPSSHVPYEPVDKDALPNAVTRQFPITLPQRQG